MNEIFRLFGTIAIDNNDANDAINETTDLGENAETRLSGAFKKIGAAVATYFAFDKIKDFGVEITNVAAEVDAEMSAFNQIMGDYADDASKKVEKIADATGMVDTRLTPYMTSMTAKFKGLGFDVENATDFAARGLNLAADASAFWDKSLDESMGHLNSFINGSYEGGEAIGLFANDTQMASYAVKQGIISQTKEWANLDEATKQATRLEYAENMLEASGATGQAAKEAGQYANVQANLTEKWRQFQAQIGEPLLQNIVIPAMTKLSEIVDKLSPAFERLQTWVNEHQTTLKILAGVIITITTALVAYGAVMGTLSIIQTVTTWLNGMTLAQKLLNMAMSVNPIGIVVAAIAALTAAFVLLWNNSEGFRNFWIGLWDGIKNAVSVAVEGVKTAFNAVVNFFTVTIPNAFNAVVNFFKDNWQSILAFIVNPFAGAFSYLYTNCEAFRNFVNNFVQSVKNFFVNAWNGIKTTSVNTWNSIRTSISNVFNGIKTTATNVWNNIKEAIEKPINKAKETVKGVVDSIKGFFDGLKIKFPDIKLPHFKITGSFSLAPPSVPRLAIDWYAKAMDNAMVLTSPTIFGINPSGQLMGGGEAGQEVVSGANTLMGMIRESVRAENASFTNAIERLISMLAEYFPEILSSMDREMVLDSGVLVGQLAPRMDRKLGDISRLKDRGQ